MGKWLICAVFVCLPLVGQSRSQLFTGNYFYQLTTKKEAFQKIGNWRLEFRIADFQPQPRDQGVFGNDNNPCHLLANSVRMRCRTWQGSSNVIDMDLAGRKDVRFRVQRNNDTGTFLVELWNGDGSGYDSASYEFRRGEYDARNGDSFVGAYYGKNSEFGGAIAFVRWYSTLAAPRSRPPLDATRTPGDLVNVEFEDEARDSSPQQHALRFQGTGQPSYVNTPTYAPVLSFQTPVAPRAGSAFSIDLNGSYSTNGYGDLATAQLQQTDGPLPLEVESVDGGVVNAILPVAGSYTFQVTLRDAEGLETKASQNLSAIATDDEGRLVLFDNSAELVLGPMIRSGAGPWPWFDDTEVRVADTLMKAIEPTPGKPLAGTITVSRGSKTVLGDGTRFRSVFKCDGSDNIAVHYPLDADSDGTRRSGLRVYNVSSCANDTELTINPAYDATRLDWRNVSYGRVTNEENARWYNGSNNWNYYDAVLAYYRLYHRTGQEKYRTQARELADRWWKYPLDEGRACETGYWCVPPRMLSLLGLMLRANDGRPELWPFIVSAANNGYTGFISNWIPDTTKNVYDIREAGYATWFQAAISQMHPDPDVRAEALKKTQVAFSRYWKPRQQPDGSWRMDIGYACPSCGYEGLGTLPWQMAFPMHGLVALHRITGDDEVLQSLRQAGDFLLKYGVDPECRGMYYDLFYSLCNGKQCGQCEFGSCGKYSCKDNGSYGSNDSRTLSNATHAVLGYLYYATGEEKYLAAGESLFGANLGNGKGGPGSDGGYGHYNDVVSGGSAPLYLAMTYLSKEFAFVGGAGGAQNYLFWRLGPPPASDVTEVDVSYETYAPAADEQARSAPSWVRLILLHPSGQQEGYGCADGVCKVTLDRRKGSYMKKIQYMADDGMVLSETKFERLRL